MKLRILTLLTLTMLCSFPLLANAATYNWYFSDDAAGNAVGNDITGDGSIGNPWKSLAKAQTEVDGANVNDTVNLFFDRGDTWAAKTSAVSTRAVYGLDIGSTDPIVNINAYGTGNKPIFDGLVSDFSSVPVHNVRTGPLMWNCFFQVNRHDCTASNIEIKRVYGSGIIIKDGDGFIFSDLEVNNFGSFSIGMNGNFAATDLTAQRCTIHTGQQLYRYRKRSGWGAGISFTSSRYKASGCVVKHCVVYDIYGEGINVPNGIAEYNVVGNTGSMGIGISPQGWDAETTIVRYNFLIMEDWSKQIYDSHAGGDNTGIRVFDELVGGVNANADISIYGNIVINFNYGFKMYLTDEGETAFGSVKVYNNLFIDSHKFNTRVADASGGPPSLSNICTDFRYYNNASILYDQTSSAHVTDNIDTSKFGGATIENNAYWTKGGRPVVDSNWDTNYVIADPKLPGEPAIDWDGQSGATYYKDIDFNTHLYPSVDSALVGAGKTLGSGYETMFLTKGTDFDTLPNRLTFQRVSQFDAPNWSIGAIVRGDGTPISPAPIRPPTGLKKTEP